MVSAGALLPDPLILAVFAVLGLLIGSFTNVLIWRLPRGENINFPPSHCPTCDHGLAPRDLVPVLSWLSLGGRCRYCRAPIKARYPVVELISGLGYATLAWAFPWSAVGPGLIGLGLLFTVLLAASVIDAETYTIPDELSLPGAALGLLFGAVNGRVGAAGAGLPDFGAALSGMLVGAGLLATINLLGSWVMRRFRERRFPDLPVDYPQVAVSLLVGVWAGPLWGVAAGAASVLVNLLARRALNVPESLTLGGFLLSLALIAGGVVEGGVAAPASDLTDSLSLLLVATRQGLEAAGGLALLAGLYWWVSALRAGRSEDTVLNDEDGQYDPVAMGFGDVKLAAAIGAFIGAERLLLALLIAVVAGAVLGLIQRLLLGENRLKFGPYLALGGVIALIWGNGIISAYLSYLGLI